MTDRLRRHPVRQRSYPAKLAFLLVVCIAFGSSVSAQQNVLRIGGTGATLATMQLLGTEFEQENPGINVDILSSLGSTGGINAALAGAINIGLSARPPTGDERRRGAVAFEYGRSPLVFAAPSSAGVAEITIAELIDIYAGKMKRWPDGTPIRLLLRPESEISTIMLQAISPEFRDAVNAAAQRPGMLFALTDQDATEILERNAGSIGPAALCQILATGSQLKALALDGVVPSPAAIADSYYPYYYRFFLVTGPKHNTLTDRFIAFVRSAAGMRILADNGFWTLSNMGDR